MFELFIMLWALIVYIALPIVLVISSCYYIAYFISCIPDIWSYVKAWWKVRFGS